MPGAKGLSVFKTGVEHRYSCYGGKQRTTGEHKLVYAWAHCWIATCSAPYRLKTAIHWHFILSYSPPDTILYFSIAIQMSATALVPQRASILYLFAIRLLSVLPTNTTASLFLLRVFRSLHFKVSGDKCSYYLLHGTYYF